MAKKAPDAFRTISEVATWLDTPAHVLRFWESKFSQVKPVKRAGGRRYYRPADMLLLGGIKKLLHEDGLTIKGVQKILREEGVKKVSSLSQPVDGAAIEADVEVEDDTVVPFSERAGAPEVEDAEVLPDVEPAAASNAEEVAAEAERGAPEPEAGDQLETALSVDAAPQETETTEEDADGDWADPPQDTTDVRVDAPVPPPLPDAVAAGMSDEADATADDTPAPLVAEGVEDDPDDDEIDADGRIADLRSADKAAMIAREAQIRGAIERLEALRARMG